MSLLTYLSSLYHVLEEAASNKKKDDPDPEKGSSQEECLDLGYSVEGESICSSNSSGYSSPISKEKKEHQPPALQMELGIFKPGDSEEAESMVSSTALALEKAKVKEAKEKLEKSIRRSGAEARRESRRLVKSMCDENTQGTNNSILYDVGERETPFSVALKKFSSLVSSQTKITMAEGWIYETKGREASVKTSYASDPSMKDATIEAPGTFHSLITRSTQTEEERRSAAAQTESNRNEMVNPTKKAANGSGNNGSDLSPILVPSKTIKTHQRRTSIHSRQQAFKLPPHHSEVHNMRLERDSFTGTTRGAYYAAGAKAEELQDLLSPHLSMQVLPQKEFVWPILTAPPKYKRNSTNSQRSNLRSAKSTPLLYLHENQLDLIHPHQRNSRLIGHACMHAQHLSGLPQSFSTLV